MSNVIFYSDKIRYWWADQAQTLFELKGLSTNQFSWIANQFRKRLGICSESTVHLMTGYKQIKVDGYDCLRGIKF